MPIISKQELKFAYVMDSLGEYSNDAFVDKFIELYEKDWTKVVNKYREHERKNRRTPHPMALPRKHVLNVSYRARGKRSEVE